MPYTVHEEAMTSGSNIKYNGYAHSFGGMAIQFLLFAMANLGIEMLLERQRGLWKRLRSAPVSKFTLLAGKAASGAIISLMILLVCFAFAMIVFKVRIQGSILGFFAVAVACALMASTFGLLVAALGNSPATARGITTLAVLMMVMLGGAWVPSFIFPAWLQQFTLGGARALGRRRPRCDDVARHRPQRRGLADACAARLRGRVQRHRRVAFQVGRDVSRAKIAA